MKKLKLFVMSLCAMFVAVLGVNAAGEIGSDSNPAKTASDIAEALGGASYAEVNGNTVTLKQTFDYNKDLVIASTAETITLDLKNYNINLGNENQIILYSQAKLTIIGTGSISNNGQYTTIELVTTGNTLTIDGPTIENKYTTIEAQDNLTAGAATGTNLTYSATTADANTIEVKSGTVKGTQGISLHTNGTGKLIVSGGTIEGTIGSGIVVNGHTTGTATVEITGGTIKANEENGIAFAASNKTTVTIDGGKFTGWVGIYAEKDSDTTINNAEIIGALYGIDSTEDSTVVINDGNITGAEAGVYSEGKNLDVKNGTISGRYGVVAYDGAKATISGGTITGEAAAVSGNGSDPSTETTITVSGGTLKGGIVGIYHPQQGKLNISGDAVIEGKSGIVARQGDVSITGGKILATGNGENITIGDAMDESDTSGRVQLPSGVAVIVDNTEDGYADEAKVEIAGGKFESKKEPLLTYGDENNSNKDIIVTAGSFDQTVAPKYLNIDVEQSENGVIGTVSKIELGEAENGTVEFPKNAAKGEDVEVTITPDEGYEIAEMTVLDENGEELPFETTETGLIFTMPEGAVTISVKFTKVDLGKADTTELEKAIAEAEKYLDDKKYDAKQVEALKKLIEEAKGLLESTDQTKVDEMVKVLADATTKVANTGDNIMSVVATGSVSLVVIAGGIVLVRKNKFNN